MARSYQELVHELQFTHYPAPVRKYQERILAIHFFGGHQRKLKRHIRFLNDLGYDVYSFNLSYSKEWIYKKVPSFKNRMWQLSNIWDRDIEEISSYVPGPIITYSFSGPSACSIQLAARSPLKNKVKAMISDSGPFTHIVRCNYNLAGHEFRFQNHIMKYFGSWVLTFLWNPNHTQELIRDLEQINPGLPYLSIQPEKDRIVPVEYMQDVFDRANHKLKLEVLRLHHSGHLNGIILEKELYRSEVSRFLETHSTPVCPPLY